jgi:hypothetical protein
MGVCPLNFQLVLIFLAQAVKLLAQPLIHADGILNVALTEAIFPSTQCTRTVPSSQTIMMRCSQKWLSNIYRSFLLFFTKIGGSFWLRGMVCGRRLPGGVSFIFIVMAVQQPTGVQRYARPENVPFVTIPSSCHLQVIHQLHRAVLDCGIESYIEKVASTNDCCLAPLMCPRLPLRWP